MRHPLTLEAFAEWLEKQPPMQEYNFIDSQGCAIFQYLQSSGFKPAGVGGGYWRTDTEVFPFDEHLLKMEDAVQTYGERTFGAAARRARELLA